MSNPTSSLHSRSKKIQRSTPISPNKNREKYQIYNSTQKVHILADLWEGLLLLELEKFAEDEFSGPKLLELIKMIDNHLYNTLLKTVLPKHIESFVPSGDSLRQWRKRVKAWLESLGKPEKRGGPLVPINKTEVFKEAVAEILKNLPYRGFQLLQGQIITVLKKFYLEQEEKKNEQDHQNSEPFDRKKYSKHWWFDYMKKNPDIKEIWENIPLERSLKKLKASSQCTLDSQFEYELGNMEPIQGVGKLDKLCQNTDANMFPSNETSVMDKNKTSEESLPRAQFDQKSFVYLSSLEEDQEDRVKDFFGRLYNNRNVEENDDF